MPRSEIQASPNGPKSGTISLNLGVPSSYQFQLSQFNQVLLQPASFKDLLKNLLGILVLVLSILGGSSIGAISNFLPIYNPFAKNAWRAGLICVYFLLPSILENWHFRKEIKYRDFLTLRKYGFLMATLLM